MIGLFFLALIAIDESVPNEPFCYPGKYEREIITFDPENSPIFEKIYDELRKKLSFAQSEEEILLNTIDFVQWVVFDLTLCTNPQVVKMIAEDGRKEIPLDAFLERKQGVCRHIALCVTLLLHRLIEEEVLHGTVYLIRENLSWGRHAWTLFLSEERAWHLDAYQGVLEDGKSRAGFSRLCQKYGKDVMQRQSTRWKDDN